MTLEALSENELRKLCRHWQHKLKVNPQRVQLRRMKNKWSSCSSKGNITLNLELLGLPREIAEYVIVHELLHLVIPNHGKTFKTLFYTYLPQWEELHQELSQYNSRNPGMK